MGEPKRESARNATLDIEEDLDHARTLWRVQRVGWVAMLLIAGAALAGVFGNGPLAQARAESGPLSVDYDRLARHGGKTTLKAEIDPAAPARGDTIRLWVDREYLQGVELEGVVPEPESVEVAADRLWFTFLVPDRSRSTQITLHIRPDEYWSRRGRAGLEQGGAVDFSQFVYP